jgi:hypothetical protein
MLRKTAVIAVLILVVSSFTLGSTVRVQTVTAAGNEGVALERFTQEWGPAGLPPMADSIGAGRLQKMAGVVSQGYVQYMPDEEDAFPPAAGFVGAGFMQMIPGMEGAAQPVAGFVSAGRVLEMPETVISEGYVPDLPDAEFTTMVIYMNDSRLERSAMPGFSYAAPVEWQLAGAAGGVLVHEGRMPDNLTIKSRMAMFKPGGAPEFFDFVWKMAYMGKRAEAGSLAVYSGHMMIPERNGSFEKVSPFGFIRGPPIGAIEISSDMVVDLANLPVDLSADVSADQTDDTYNNEISAGQTNWHSASVGNAVKSVNVDLKWRNPDGKLRLVVYTPDGKVLGPYYDDSDGKTDGRINLNIANPSGVASGEWHLKVTDMATLGNNDYYVRTY